jgi:hypothetical protein
MNILSFLAIIFLTPFVFVLAIVILSIIFDLFKTLLGKNKKKRK